MRVNSIYDDIKPLLIMSKIFGKTNLNIASYGKLKFEWGIHCIWPFFLFGINLNMAIWTLTKNNSALTWFWSCDNTFRELSRLLSTLYADIRTPNIIANIYTFDMEHGRPLNRKIGPRYFFIAYVLLTLLILTAVVIDIFTFGLSIRDITESMNRYSTSIFPLLYLFLCDEICKRFRSLQIRWQSEIVQIIEVDRRAITCQVLESERLAHAKLCDIVDDIRTTFGPRITTYLLFVFIDHLARFYFIAYVKTAFENSHPNVKSIITKDLDPYLFIAHTWTGTYLIAYMSDLLTESSKTIMSHLRSIPIWKLSKESVDQVVFFMYQVQNLKTEISACGLFTVNKSIFSTMTISLATYIIVIIQLSPDLNRIFKN
ncbi:uncharacterized protein LOC126902522 isoform X3 [Daktulosphaira vitifoliae]|uniref:uncharacterized protein LOC126902522 isoform X3 n=1 Tax=Daktulosphaira vitifoliae TaxID=58002 RepID=UPI0021AA27FD|nr:uncharacterized protein LOC126902522 isoform X3 [Daktulosphaira vitifoliae]